MGGFADDEIPLLVMLFYLFRTWCKSRPARTVTSSMRLQTNSLLFPSSPKRSVSGLVAPSSSALGWDKTRGLRS